MRKYGETYEENWPKAWPNELLISRFLDQAFAEGLGDGFGFRMDLKLVIDIL